MPRECATPRTTPCRPANRSLVFLEVSPSIACGGSNASMMIEVGRGSTVRKNAKNVSALAKIALCEAPSYFATRSVPHFGIDPGAPRHHPVVVARSSARISFIVYLSAVGRAAFGTLAVFGRVLIDE